MCEEHPKLSVVVPTFRRPHLLGSCLRSLVRQCFIWGSFEIVVVIDGHDPESCRLVDRMQADHPFAKIRFVNLKENRGPAAARNIGWRCSCGELIVFTDDDCIATPFLASYYWEAYRRDSGAAFTGSLIVPLPPVPTDYEKNTARLETADFVTANCAIPKAMLEELGGFDEMFRMAWREDSDLHFKILEHNHPVLQIEQAVIRHPVRRARWGISIREQRKASYNALLFKKHPLLYQRYISAYPLWNYYFILIGFCGALLSLATRHSAAAMPFIFIWTVLSGQLIIKRLKGTLKTPGHLAEMIVTSLAIPFLSIYWTLYGSVRHRVLLL
jgi:glycosyltransferase involved in cell wall biosynthesis